MNRAKSLIPTERIQTLIVVVRGQKVLLDRDLAILYGVETRVLNQAVKRNRERFPADFMFELTRDEIIGISQIVTSSEVKFSKRVTVFTEQGVAMLSSVLTQQARDTGKHRDHAGVRQFAGNAGIQPRTR